MTAFNYARSKATAERLISNFGQDAVLRQIDEADPDDFAPSVTPVDTVVRVVDLNVVDKFSNASLAERVMRKLLMSTSAGVQPETGDQVQVAGQWHNVGVVMPLRPGGVTIMYEVELVD